MGPSNTFSRYSYDTSNWNGKVFYVGKGLQYQNSIIRTLHSYGAKCHWSSQMTVSYMLLLFRDTYRKLSMGGGGGGGGGGE